MLPWACTGGGGRDEPGSAGIRSSRAPLRGKTRVARATDCGEENRGLDRMQVAPRTIYEQEPPYRKSRSGSSKASALVTDKVIDPSNMPR